MTLMCPTEQSRANGLGLGEFCLQPLASRVHALIGTLGMAQVNDTIA